MHLFISVQFTLHMFRPWLGHHQGYVHEFTSLFTGPFGIITTVTLFKAIIYIGNHRYTKFLQVMMAELRPKHVYGELNRNKKVHLLV
jgi:hypothetical protein